MPATLYILLPVLCAASLSDWKHRKISNSLLLPSFMIALLVNFFTFGINGLLSSLLGASVGFALLIVPYLFGGIGAGDVKYLMVIGSFGGLQLVIYSFLLGAITGGIISTGILIYNLKSKNKIHALPYGIPLSLGTVIYLVLQYL